MNERLVSRAYRLGMLFGGEGNRLWLVGADGKNYLHGSPDKPRSLLSCERYIADVEEQERRRVADPNYIPTIAEAMRNPKEFVDGFTEI